MPRLSRYRLLSSVAVAASLSVALAGCTSSKSHAASSSTASPSPSTSAPASPTSQGPASTALTPAASSAAPSAPISSPAAVSSPAVSSPAAAGPPATPQTTAIALQPADLPAGWTGTPSDPNPTAAADSAQLARCMGARDTYPDETGDSNSDDYSLDNASISSEVTSMRTADDVKADTAIVTNPKIDTCYGQLAEAQLREGLPAGSTLKSESFVFTPGPAGGPKNVVATAAGKVELTVNSEVEDLYVNVAFITGPLIEAEVDFTNLGAPVPTTLRSSLIAKIAARAAAAAAEA